MSSVFCATETWVLMQFINIPKKVDFLSCWFYSVTVFIFPWFLRVCLYLKSNILSVKTRYLFDTLCVCLGLRLYMFAFRKTSVFYFPWVVLIRIWADAAVMHWGSNDGFPFNVTVMELVNYLHSWFSLYQLTRFICLTSVCFFSTLPALLIMIEGCLLCSFIPVTVVSPAQAVPNKCQR